MTTLDLESNGLGEYAVKVCEHLSKLTNLTSLYLAHNDLGEHAVKACEHLIKLPNLTSLCLNENDLGEHAVGVCRSFLKPLTAIEMSLDLDGNKLSPDIQKQCLDVVQENQNLREQGFGVVWLNGLFHKKEKEANLKIAAASTEDQEEPIDRDQESVCQKLATDPTIRLLDIPNPQMEHILEYARPVGSLKIDGLKNKL